MGGKGRGECKRVGGKGREVSVRGWEVRVVSIQSAEGGR